MNTPLPTQTNPSHKQKEENKQTIPHFCRPTLIPLMISLTILILLSLNFICATCNFWTWLAITLLTGIRSTNTARPANTDGPKGGNGCLWLGLSTLMKVLVPTKRKLKTCASVRRSKEHSFQLSVGLDRIMLYIQYITLWS